MVREVTSARVPLPVSTNLCGFSSPQKSYKTYNFKFNFVDIGFLRVGNRKEVALNLRPWGRNIRICPVDELFALRRIF